ncbi:PREDICTED: uncharacterized protein LOC106813952 [Priapulus caudatus]|uniref:Uncharacterized protein LOC106813952 n=1 Tax=Priapulus caudatus TaxID=37621 RepID=A0ABM1ENB6_PRICU|nr:PREDICTED: uncharacterized protein LOC106813952 [Priapulus caudatus]
MRRSLQRMSALLVLCLLMQEFHLSMQWQLMSANIKPETRRRRHADSNLNEVLGSSALALASPARDKRSIGAIARLTTFFRAVAPLAKLVTAGLTASAYIVEIGLFALHFVRLVSDECIHVFYPDICDKQDEISQLAKDITTQQNLLKASKTNVEAAQNKLGVLATNLTDLNNNNFVAAQLYNAIVEDADTVKAIKLNLDSIVGASKADEIMLGAYDIALSIADSAQTQVESFNKEAGVNVAIQGSLLAFTLVIGPLLSKGFGKWKAKYRPNIQVANRPRRGAISLSSSQAKRLRFKVGAIAAGKALFRGVLFLLPLASAGLLLGFSIKQESDVHSYLVESLKTLREAKFELLAKNINATRTEAEQAASFVEFNEIFVNMTATYEYVSRPATDTLCTACTDCQDLSSTYCTEKCSGDAACVTKCQASRAQKLCASCRATAGLYVCDAVTTKVSDKLEQDNMNVLKTLQENFLKLLTAQKNSLKFVLGYMKDRSDALTYIVKAATLTPPKTLAAIVQDLQLSPNYPDYTRKQVIEFLHAAKPTWTTFDGCSLTTGACWDTIVADGVSKSQAPSDILVEVNKLDATKTLNEVLAAIKGLRPTLTQYQFCLLAAPFTCAETKINAWIHATPKRSVPFMQELLLELGFSTITEKQVLTFVAKLLPGQTTYKGCSLTTLTC